MFVPFIITDIILTFAKLLFVQSTFQLCTPLVQQQSVALSNILSIITQQATLSIHCLRVHGKAHYPHCQDL